MSGHRSSPVQGSEQIAPESEGIVDDHRDAKTLRGIDDGLEVGNVQCRITDRLDEPCPGSIVGQPSELVWALCPAGETRFDSGAWKRHP